MFGCTGALPGEEPSSHLHPETERLPRPGRHPKGELGNIAQESLAGLQLLTSALGTLLTFSAEVQTTSPGVDSDAARAGDLTAHQPHWVAMICRVLVVVLTLVLVGPGASPSAN